VTPDKIMTENLQDRVQALRNILDNLSIVFDLKKLSSTIKALEVKTTDPTFWDNQDQARKTLKELETHNDLVARIRKLKDGVETLEELLKEGSLDPSFVREIGELEDLAGKLKLDSFLSGPYDKKNAIVTIHAGQGGVEAMDWASMLYRMYIRFIEKKGWEATTIDFSEGDEAGIKSVTFKVVGTMAYGYLKGEAGTHRLVRQSPFNADNLRQTSFALVGVLPELEEGDLPDIKIKDEDLTWQFYRSGGHGGQNVNKVSTAVRLIYKPTGITVTASEERFQEQNRKIAMDLLRAKLWILEKERKENKVSEIKGEYRPASWGNQIRSYVLHPYKMVKDLRTKVQTSDCDSVLSGDIDEFIEAELMFTS